uniref:Dynein intermediate chain protein n=1 Tax=Chaetomium thermophilum (strain DSM 1495 / CBS 144.50 / IMI 039719) TaxID=759272 RepID=UPI001606F466|nr:Chain A, Dynein intermediate chain protein [Thermochaetoides thermophila DSM 1495]
GAHMMQARREELLAKKARLAEIKRQRELRAQQAAGRSITPSELVSPTPSRANSRREIESLIDSILSSSAGANSPRRGSRPNSVISTGELSTD